MRDGGIERGATEAALRESEANYRALIDDLPELICRSLPDLTRTHVNDGYCSYFGKSREELIGRNFLDFLPEEDRKPLKEHLVSLTPKNPVSTFEHRVWRQDGEVRWQQWTNRAVFDEAGKLLGYQAVGRDYNVRKLAEEALKESEEAHRRQARELSLLHQVRTVLAREHDPAAVFRAVVEAVAETYGYVLVSAYLLEGEHLVLQYQVGYRSVLERIPVVRGVMGRVARTGEPAFLEDAHADPEFLDAIQGVVSEICVPLLDGGEVVGTLNVESTGGTMLAEEDLRLVEAVSEQASVALGRTRLHARLEEAEQRYRALVENVPAVVYTDGVDEANRGLGPPLPSAYGRTRTAQRETCGPSYV